MGQFIYLAGNLLIQLFHSSFLLEFLGRESPVGQKLVFYKALKGRGRQETGGLLAAHPGKGLAASRQKIPGGESAFLQRSGQLFRKRKIRQEGMKGFPFFRRKGKSYLLMDKRNFVILCQSGFGKGGFGSGGTVRKRRKNLFHAAERRRRDFCFS